LTAAAYSDPRLAAVYDALNPPGPDTAFYTTLAGAVGRRVLDVGCGTGWLAVELAALGHRVTGGEPAAAMLAIARQRPGGQHVTWIEGTAAGLALAARFDLIVMTGHVFQVFLTDQEAFAALANLRRHLAPGGRLAFETRNPAARAWLTWTPAETRRSVEVPGLGGVQVHHDVTRVEDELVTYETHFRFGPGDVVVDESQLRFMPQATLARLLTEAGFGQATWYGDWDRAPVGPESRELIVVAG
jgi:SAM-dependent methyltransferase